MGPGASRLIVTGGPTSTVVVVFPAIAGHAKVLVIPPSDQKIATVTVSSSEAWDSIYISAGEPREPTIEIVTKRKREDDTKVEKKQKVFTDNNNNIKE